MKNKLSGRDMSRTAKPWEELTPAQQINRKRNERAKLKRQNVFNITGEQRVESRSEVEIKNPVTVDLSVSKQLNTEVQALSSSNRWRSIATNLMEPGVCFSLICLVGLSSYLVWQYSKTPNGDITTGIVIEALGIIYATIATTSLSKFIRTACIGAILATVFYTSVILHGGLKTTASKSDESISALVQERTSVQAIVESKTRMAEELPSGYVTKKQAIMDDVSQDMVKIEAINAKLDTINKSNQGDVFAGLIIRILAMFANAYMVHLVVKGLRK